MKPCCLFICPTKYNYNFVKPERVKYAVLTLLSHITDLAEVEVLDLEMMFGYPRTMHEISLFITHAEKELSRYLPDIICITCYTSFDYMCTIDILKLCKKIHPNATLVVGGYHPTAVPEDFLDADIPVDYIIRGEGEVTLRSIIIQNGRHLPQVITGEPLELSNERPLRYDLYPYKTDELYISLSRGCFHQCAFCVQSDDFQNPYRKMDLEKIKDKIVRATEFFPIRRILFSDPIFGIDLEETSRLVEFLSNRYAALSYWAETRIDRTTEEMVKCLSKINIDLHFGVESLAEDTLINLMAKTRNAESYNNAFFRTVDLCQKYNVLGLFGFIMNYPGELDESSTFTMSQLRKVLTKYEKLNVTFHINPYALYPGNTIYKRRFELAESRGFRFENDYWWKSLEPDIRQRSENCLASDSIARRYEANHHYWHAEKNELLREYVSRYSYKAYKFYQRTEIKESIHSIKGVEEKNREIEYDLVARYRYLTSKYLNLYITWIRKNAPALTNTFSKFYLYITYNKQKELLMHSLFNKDDITTVIDSMAHTLAKEFPINISTLENKGSSFSIVFFGQIYQLSQDGTVKFRKESTL